MAFYESQFCAVGKKSVGSESAGVESAGGESAGVEYAGVASARAMAASIYESSFNTIILSWRLSIMSTADLIKVDS